MADNSNNKKKTLFISVLLFLAAGGGVFLFMVIQGSNDITKGKGNTFTYGSAAREGVSSFFKYLGVVSEDERDVFERKTKEILAKRDEGMEAAEASDPDVSSWMAPAGGGKGTASASGNTAVPRMSGGGTSGVGGIGSGGSKSAGGVSRFGEGAGAGNATISRNAASSAGGPVGKGALASLSNSRAVLGEGLRSGSAMTAKGKWDSSFGVGHAGKGGGDLTYGRGLVNLDSIKKGEIDNLKTRDIKSLKVTEPGEFKQDKEAESKDSVLNAAKKTAEDAAKKAAEDAAKKAALQALASAGTNSNKDTKDTRSTSAGSAAGGEIPENVQTLAEACKYNNGASGGSQDTSAVCGKNADGTYSVTYEGTRPNPEPGKSPIPYTHVLNLSAKGEYMGWEFQK